MSLTKLVLGVALLGACATAQPQIKPIQRSSITDAFCGVLNGHKICIAQYPEMEVVYAHYSDDEMPYCSIMIDYHADKSSDLLRNDGCNSTVDSYLHTTGESQTFMIRSEFEGKFKDEFDPLYDKLKNEVLDAVKKP